MKRCDETAVILHYRPRIIRLCETRWPYMPMDEKISEAMYYMFCALRTPSIKASTFWRTYLSSFSQHMDNCYRDEGRHRFTCLSLDASHISENREGEWTLLQCLSDTISAEDAIIVKDFIATLPERTKRVLMDLIEGVPRAQIMRKHKLTPSAFAQIRRELQNAYRAWEGWSS